LAGWRVRLLAAATAALALGCDPGPEEPEPFDLPDGGVATTVLEVGTGRDRFVPLGEADEVEVVFGPQGGYHIWGSLRTRGLDPDNAEVHFRVALEGPPETTLSESRYVLPLQKSGRWHQWLGLIGFVPEPAEVYGRRVLLSMTVRDRGGRTLSDTRTVIPKAPAP
jgi:hypothetical protein